MCCKGCGCLKFHDDEAKKVGDVDEWIEWS